MSEGTKGPTAARRRESARSAALFAACWLSACAAPLVEGGTPTEGAVYDAAAEWSRESALVRATRPAPSWLGDCESSAGMRPFNEAERARIAEVQWLVRSAAREHRIPTDLINAIIWVESKFVVRARSPSGAQGLMQMMPGTARELAGQEGLHYDPYDPRFNVTLGTLYFARLLARFQGNLRLALAAYNIGPTVVRGWVAERQPLPERSLRYVENVFMAADAFRALAAEGRGEPARVTRVALDRCPPERRTGDLDA